jgi:GNAT superfamily N-acetyltransferase
MGQDSDRPVLLGRRQIGQASAVLNRAFHDDPLSVYIFPDESERARCLGRQWHALVAYGQLFGHVYTTPSLAGVACWLPPGKATASFWSLLRTGFALPRSLLAMRGEGRRRFFAVLSHEEDVHGRLLPQPHWYLGALAVEPARQRQGVGSRLLQPVLALADAEGCPCYLETQSVENVRFYERLGFRVAHEGQVPGHPLTLWALIRPAGERQE